MHKSAAKRTLVLGLKFRIFPTQRIDTRYYAAAFRTCQLHSSIVEVPLVAFPNDPESPQTMSCPSSSEFLPQCRHRSD